MDTGTIKHKQSEIRVNSEDALQLLQKMLKRGFFRPDSPLTSTSTRYSQHAYTYPDNDIDDMNDFIKSSKIDLPACDSDLIISACDGSHGNDIGQGCVMTRDFLTSQIRNRIDCKYGGRASMQLMASEMKVAVRDVNQCVVELCKKEKSCLRAVGMEVMTDAYLFKKCQDLQQIIKDRESIHNIANDWNLPLQFTLDAIQSRMNIDGLFLGIKLTVDSDGAKQLLTNNYEQIMLRKVEELLLKVKVPTKLCELTNQIRLDSHQVLQHVKHLCSNKILDGSLRADESNASNFSTVFGAVYIPSQYEENKKKDTLDFFDFNRYASPEKTGMSKKCLDECISKHNSQAIILSVCVVHPDLTTKFQSLIEDSIEAQSFIDLSSHVPEGMPVTDVETLMNEHILCSMKDSVRRGCSIFMSNGELFYFSVGMIERISKGCLPALIDVYSKTRAIEIANSGLEHECTSLKDNKNRKVKAKSKAERKRHKMKTSSDNDTIAYGKVDLYTVANAIAETYPDVLDIQANYCVSEQEGGPSWDNCDENIDGPLYAFIRSAFGNSAFEQKCSKAVKAELEIILAGSKVSRSTMQSKGNGAIKVMDIEASFEQSFKMASQWIQIQAKYPASLLNSDADSNVIEDAIATFLNGCAASFTKRITEYCIFKHGIEGIEFHDDGHEVGSSDLFYMPVNTTLRAFPKVYLACQRDNAMRDPLKMLREYLPGTSGIELGRMWKLCGGENYAGGDSRSEDGTTLDERVRDFEKFLPLAEESCLSICGIPFKKLDKKFEKQILFGRKKELRAQLEQSENDHDIIELSFILLIQQLKNMVISGYNVTSSSVDALISAKKIPDHVTDVLKGAASFLHNDKNIGTPIPPNIVNSIRLCGLSKDITSLEHLT